MSMERKPEEAVRKQEAEPSKPLAEKTSKPLAERKVLAQPAPPEGFGTGWGGGGGGDYIPPEQRPSNVMSQMLKEGASAYQAISYWQSQGRSISEIDPDSSVGKMLQEKAGGDWQEVEAQALEFEEEKVREEFGIPKSISLTVTVGKETDKPKVIYNTKDIRVLQQSEPYLWSVLTSQGIDAYKEAVRQRTGAENLATRDWLNRHVQLPDGQWISRTNLNQIEKESPKVHELLVTMGLNSANNYVSEQNKLYELNQEAIKKLEPYTNKEGLVNLSAYLDTYPGDRSTLVNAGIDSSVVDSYIRNQEIINSVDKNTWLALLGVITSEMHKKYEQERDVFAKLTPKQKMGEMSSILNKWLATETRAGTTGIETSTEQTLEKLRGIRETAFISELPAPVKEPLLFGTSVLYGAALMAPAYTASFAGELLKTVWETDKLQHVKNIGKGMGDYFTKEIPRQFKTDPTMTTGELIGMFVVGYDRLLSWAKSGTVKLSPSYIPKRGIAIEYSVVKIPERIATGKLITEAVNKAIVQAMKDPKGEAIVKIGDGRIRLKLRSTPMSETVGSAFYHVTPELLKSLEAGKVQGKLFVSPQAAFRFAESTAHGLVGEKPAVLMIFTKDGKVKWSVTENLYKGAKEIEATYPSTQLYRVKNLQSRLLLGKTGEFVTVHNGKIIPVYRFAESGATVPRIGLSELAAVRLRTIKATLSDLVKGRRGYEILDKESLKELTRRIERESEKLSREKGLSLEQAVDTVTRREIDRIYRTNPTEFERLFRLNMNRFEELYRTNLAHSMSEYYIDITRPEEKALAYAEVLERMKAEEAQTREIKPVEREQIARSLQGVMRPTTEEIETIAIIPREVIPREEMESGMIGEPTEIRGEIAERRMSEVVGTTQAPTKETIRRGYDTSREERLGMQPGIIAWRQGFVWWTVSPPYRSQKDIKCLKQPPQGATIVKGSGSAYKTIQALGGDANILLTIDMGAFDVKIDKPSRAGKTGSIKFKKDTRQKTTSQLSISGVKAS